MNPVSISTLGIVVLKEPRILPVLHPGRSVSPFLELGLHFHRQIGALLLINVLHQGENNVRFR